MRALSESGTERVIMGNGSNMLFTGDTYEGVIVQIARTGELAEVKSAITKTVEFFKEELGFEICEVFEN